MGFGLLEIGVQVRKVVVFPIRTVCYHPFLVVMLCFLAFLYTSFPFVFSLLVYVSPVLVCTAFLLGTLLSYGQPNILQYENTSDEDIVPLKDGLSSTRVERDTDQERDKEDQSTDKPSMEVNKLSEVHRGQRFGGHSPLVAAASGEVARELYEQKNEEKNGVANQYSPTSKVDDESVDFDIDKSVDSFDSRRVNLDSPPGSPWKQREEEYDEALDSGSDRAESSSPDASIADIMPMLDELHPLLDEDTPQPVSLSHDVSHAASESSSKSSESDDESDDGSEDQEELEVGDDENEDGEDEEEARDEEDPKSAITWTAEDQKNLMDLGSSELERNQRLESLIARRRSRKNMSMIDEKNLIDLVTSDTALNIPPISTARNNPFDLPNDNYDLGLPPIPGSAPSILLPRRNPFDLPYDPSEEKPDLTGETFQQEFIAPQPKEPFFRRHESFNVGPSIFGLNKQEKKDIRWKPYFVPDLIASEGTSYSPFQRQPSDLSDSKVSSVLETESQGSIEDLEDKSPTDEDVEDKNLNEELKGKNLTDEHVFKEPELISKIEPSEDVGHGSQSSEEVECLVLGAADKRDIELDATDVKLQNAENHHEVGPILFHGETSEQKCSSHSSSSSASEVSERIFADKEVVRLSSEEAACLVETISGQLSPNGSDLNITSSSVDENSHLEPIYDASPPSIRKNMSSSSIASDLLPDSEVAVAPELVKTTVSSIEPEPVENKQDSEKSIPTNERICSSLDSQELRLREVAVDTDERDVAKPETCKDDEVFGSASAPPEPLLDSQASIDSKSSKKEPSASLVVSIEDASTIESLNVSKIREVPPIINSSRNPECVLDRPNAKVATEESESLKNGPAHKVSSLKDHDEPGPTADVDSNHKHIPEGNADRHVLHDSTDGSTHARESNDKGASVNLQNVGSDSATKQLLQNRIDKPNTSFQQESGTRPSEASSSMDSGLSAKEVVSEKSEADAGKVDHKVVTQEDKATATGKPDHAVELPQQTGEATGDVKGNKEKPHKSGSSSSSE